MKAAVSSETLWEVRTSSELSGATFTVGWYLNYGDAVDSAKGSGAWGSDGSVKQHPNIDVVRLFDDAGKQTGIFLLGLPVIEQLKDPKLIKAKALAKLTDEEKEALGLD